MKDFLETLLILALVGAALVLISDWYGEWLVGLMMTAIRGIQ